jgi:hypothetical protein
VVVGGRLGHPELVHRVAEADRAGPHPPEQLQPPLVPERLAQLDQRRRWCLARQRHELLGHRGREHLGVAEAAEHEPRPAPVARQQHDPCEGRVLDELEAVGGLEHDVGDGGAVVQLLATVSDVPFDGAQRLVGEVAEHLLVEAVDDVDQQVAVRGGGAGEQGFELRVRGAGVDLRLELGEGGLVAVEHPGDQLGRPVVVDAAIGEQPPRQELVGEERVADLLRPSRGRGWSRDGREQQQRAVAAGTAERLEVLEEVRGRRVADGGDPLGTEVERRRVVGQQHAGATQQLGPCGRADLDVRSGRGRGPAQVDQSHHGPAPRRLDGPMHVGSYPSGWVDMRRTLGASSVGRARSNGWELPRSTTVGRDGSMVFEQGPGAPPCTTPSRSSTSAANTSTVSRPSNAPPAAGRARPTGAAPGSGSPPPSAAPPPSRAVPPASVPGPAASPD